MVRPLLSLFLLTMFAAAPVPVWAQSHAETPIPPAPGVDARAYILVDFHSGKVLASKEPTAREEPASLTKLMTAYLVFSELAAGKLKLDDQVVVSEHAWRAEGSRTFIELGKPVSVMQMLSAGSLTAIADLVMKVLGVVAQEAPSAPPAAPANDGVLQEARS